MDNFIEYQDERFHSHFDYIKKYYRILLGQYKHDTTYREYDIKQKNLHQTYIQRNYVHEIFIYQILYKYVINMKMIRVIFIKLKSYQIKI